MRAQESRKSESQLVMSWIESQRAFTGNGAHVCLVFNCVKISKAVKFTVVETVRVQLWALPFLFEVLGYCQQQVQAS